MIFPPAGSLGGTATSALSGSSSSNGSSNGSGSIGFSFSPGGLLLPYHMGVAECLVHEKFLDPSETMVAGSSAGSIASMAIGCGIDPRAGLEGTIAISDRCLETGKSARGNLLPLLQDQLQSLVGDAEFDFLQQRRTNNRNRRGSGSTEEDDDDDDAVGTGVVLAYREIFPTRTSHFQTTFESREELFRSVGYSCMFPFFTTNFPCLIDFGNNGNNDNNSFKVPRLLMDGYFSLPRSQFGCPILQDEFPDSGVDRTIAVSCIPQDLFGMEEVFDQQGGSNSNSNNVISINGNDETEQMSTTDIFRIATQPTSRKELTNLYERGYRDAERWCRREQDNQNQSRQDGASSVQS